MTVLSHYAYSNQPVSLSKNMKKPYADNCVVCHRAASRTLSRGRGTQSSITDRQHQRACDNDVNDRHTYARTSQTKFASFHRFHQLRTSSCPDNRMRTARTVCRRRHTGDTNGIISAQMMATEPNAAAAAGCAAFERNQSETRAIDLTDD
jgi:hypothetical protein